MVAAAIGGHLSRITKEAGEARALGEASDTVRDASLDLLKALHRGHDVNGARKAALESVELLEAALPDAQRVDIAESGHGAHLSHPDEFARFVRSRVARAAG